MLGALVALDLFLFYVFWEVMLVPMYFLIGVWGGPRRIYAAIKFVLFTMVGSLLMLVAILYCAWRTARRGRRDDVRLRGLARPAAPLAAASSSGLFAAFALAFAIKVPLFPLHTWLPDAHVEAPTGGSVILAGVLLKMGRTASSASRCRSSRRRRVRRPRDPDARRRRHRVRRARRDRAADLKKLVAYSSVSHLGFVMLGLFALTPTAVAGSVYQMLNHGLSTGGSSSSVGMIYERRTRGGSPTSAGSGRPCPSMRRCSSSSCSPRSGSPGCNGFVGEFLILLGAFRDWPWATAVATSGVIFAALYLLWMYERVMFGPLVHEENKRLSDLSRREVAVLVPIIALCFLMGVYPKPFFERIQPSVDRMIDLCQAERGGGAAMIDNWQSRSRRSSSPRPRSS
jgi:NADH-quinone oxidoreductase subunit M